MTSPGREDLDKLLDRDKTPRRIWSPKKSGKHGWKQQYEETFDECELVEDGVGLGGDVGGGKGGGGGDGGGGDGGGERVQLQLMEKHIKDMQHNMTKMQKELDDLRAENEKLKGVGAKHHAEHKSWDNQKWGEETWKAVDGWKGWKDKGKSRDEGNQWEKGAGNEGEKGANHTNYGRDGNDAWWPRGRWGEEKYDRQNEMIARGFNRNTYWKDIKARVEDVLGVSNITYERVKVIGEKASFAIIKFDKYETKQEFKKWLSWNGKEVKQERGMWFGDNVDKRSRDREVAVGLVMKALMGAKEGRKDVYRDYRQGKVWVGNELVSKWEDDSQVMTFRGEGKDIRGAYKSSKVGWLREEDEFSE